MTVESSDLCVTGALASQMGTSTSKTLTTVPEWWSSRVLEQNCWLDAWQVCGLGRLPGKRSRGAEKTNVKLENETHFSHSPLSCACLLLCSLLSLAGLLLTPPCLKSIFSPPNRITSFLRLYHGRWWHWLWLSHDWWVQAFALQNHSGYQTVQEIQGDS
jgi:hypothetical protein